MLWLTWVQACEPAEQGSAQHGDGGGGGAGAQDLRSMAHHQAPLVKDLEGKGEDDDAQEAHEEVACPKQPRTLQSKQLHHASPPMPHYSMVLPRQSFVRNG